MKDQFISMLEHTESSLQLATINLRHVISLKMTNSYTTVITMTDGHVVMAACSIIEIHDLLANPNPSPGDLIVPSARKIFDQERSNRTGGPALDYPFLMN